MPGRKGMSWEDADWVDEDATAHRDLEDWSQPLGGVLVAGFKLPV